MLDSPPVIDGEIGEDEWAGAAIIDGYFVQIEPEYGQLSGIDVGKIRLGSTVDLDEYEKDNPRDFTLFKRSVLTELKQGIFFETPWGNVRPGWHVECAAISTRHLGEQFDVHVSSTHLLFPHLENDVAVCLAAYGKVPARYWCLSEILQTCSGRKLS